jgi:hypothetical protein
MKELLRTRPLCQELRIASRESEPESEPEPERGPEPEPGPEPQPEPEPEGESELDPDAAGQFRVPFGFGPAGGTLSGA